mgnify:CR=1 FL=1
MAAPKGHKKAGGRQKGTANKLSSGAKANVIGVFDKIGGRDAMASWARKNPTEFYRLYGRLLPTDLTIDPDANVIKVVHETL